MNAPKNKWIVSFATQPGARLRLFCFPFSGGQGQVFRPWAQELPASIEVCATTLPGRGARFRESPLTAIEPVIEALAEEIGPLLDRPFALFGHSLGAAIAFELCRRLLDAGKRPVHLFVSGRRAPHVPRSRECIHHLPEEEFLGKLAAFNGTPQEILQHKELMELMSPVVRADFTISETYSFKAGTVPVCPITAFGGASDTETSEEDVKAWGAHTTGGFSYHILDGDHFFINSCRAELLRLIRHKLPV